jgi:hypothetical protein
MKWVATPTANDPFRVYLITSNASATAAATDGGTTFGDGTVTSETVAAAQYLYLGSVIAATATDQAWCASGTVEILDRYIGIFGFNAAVAKALSGTAGEFVFTLTPIMDEIEAAA